MFKKINSKIQDYVLDSANEKAKSIIQDAEREAENIIQNAKNKANKIVTESELMKQIQIRAEEIREKVSESCDKMRSDAKTDAENIKKEILEKAREEYNTLNSNIDKYCLFNFGRTQQIRSTHWIVGKDCKYSVLRKDGKLIADFIYDEIDGILFGDYEFISVWINGKAGLIDLDGNVIIPPKYENPIFIKNNTAIVKQNNKYGIIDIKDNILIPIIYDNVEILSPNQAKVVLEDREDIIKF